MSPAYGNGGSSNKGLWITLGVVGGIFLLCGGIVLAFVLGGFFMARHAAKSIGESIAEGIEEVDGETVAEEFLDEIGAGHLDSAYEELTTRGFRTRQTLQQFRAFVDQHPGLKKPRVVDGNPESSTPIRVTVKATVIPQKGPPIQATVQMVKEDDEWKVDRLTIP
jgi:hypothetical protein